MAVRVGLIFFEHATIIRESDWAIILAKEFYLYMEEEPWVSNELLSRATADNRDHGEQWEDKDMCTPEMLGPDGKRTMDLVKLTAEQVAIQKAVAHLVVVSSDAGTQSGHRRRPRSTLMTTKK
jgi:hypothetical protein